MGDSGTGNADYDQTEKLFIWHSTRVTIRKNIKQNIRQRDQDDIAELMTRFRVSTRVQG